MSALTPVTGIKVIKNTAVQTDGLLVEFVPDPEYGDVDGETENKCRISSYDTEKGMRKTIDCKVISPGSFVVNKDKINQIVSSLPDGDVTLETDENGRILNVTGRNAKFRIPVTSADEFPRMPKYKGEYILVMKQYKLKEAIHEVLFSINPNSDKPAFQGALLKIENDSLTCVGCDGNRLAVSKVGIDGGDSAIDTIVPGIFLGELERILRDSEDDVSIVIGPKHITFFMNGIIFFTRKIEAEFLKYENIIPKTYRTQAYLSRSEVLGALKRAAIFAEDRAGKPFIKLDFNGRSVKISSISEGGSANDEVDAAIDGQDISIGFNAKFLMEAFSSCSSDYERIRIKLNTPLVGAIIEPADGPSVFESSPDPSVYGSIETVKNGEKEFEKSFLYFVMPVKMRNI